MVITKLKGGLGNQLFQSAAGLRLACARKTKLKMDLSALEDQACRTPRSYEMGAFQFSAEIASLSEVAALVLPAPSRFRGWLPNWTGVRSNPSATERHFHFDPDVLSLPDGSCLEGYWQSERYFADSTDRVRKEFSFRKPPLGQSAEIIAKMASCIAVSLHVRRGDYLTDPAANATHGVCSLDYYRTAIDYISERVSTPVFFLFSDEPEWVRENLEFRGSATVIDHNGPEAGYEDLRLMSQCAHHIIANSSFSWWGAWLNPNRNKIVVAPEKWFADGLRDTSDLLPANWVKL
ncbi:MAG: alpha-1,2-fucosyltransferase [Myxococcales bacterium]|nr:alpha-1,2-fucosyltransferase [Myxococcales bacterium]